MNSIIRIDKPKGITSFDCIRILRRRLAPGEIGSRSKLKIGHAGTLDPMATGLLIIGVGEGTKKLHEFLKLPKTYEAEILLGVETDTGDITGKIKDLRLKIEEISWEKIQKVLGEMVGKLELPVPMYSAIKREGEPLYKKARRGERFEAPIKPMEMRACALLEITDNIVRVRFDVSSGTYIRSLAEEFGRRLGIPATLAGLRRTKIGDFRLEGAESLPEEEVNMFAQRKRG